MIFQQDLNGSITDFYPWRENLESHDPYNVKNGWLFCFKVYQPILGHLTPNRIFKKIKQKV